MKKLSDYTGKEAIELWADLFEPISKILTDDEIQKDMTSANVVLFDVAQKVLKKYPDEMFTVLSRIDTDEINGANALNKVIVLLAELKYGNRVSAFFNSAERGTSAEESSGSATENIEDGSK